jgi:hypothetical protein
VIVLPQEEIQDDSDFDGNSGSEGYTITSETVRPSPKGISYRGGDTWSAVHQYVPDDDVVFFPWRHNKTEAPSCAVGGPLDHLTDGDTREPGLEGAVRSPGRIYGLAVAGRRGQGGGHVDPGPVRSPVQLVAAGRTEDALRPSGKRSTTQGTACRCMMDNDPLRTPPLEFAQEECKSSCSAPASLTMESCKGRIGGIKKRLVGERE